MAIERASLSKAFAAIAECEVQSLPALFDARVLRSASAIACRWFQRSSQQWQALTWAELDAKAECYADALAALQLPVGSRIALMLDNGPDWLAIEQAIYRVGCVSVGIFPTDTPGNAAHVMASSGAAVGFIRNAALWLSIAAENPLTQLQRVVLMEGAGDAAATDPRAQVLAVFLASATEHAPRVMLADTALASLVYTSGTTGPAKGAMLTHAALLANVFACERAFNSGSSVVKLSLLPLSHSFERVAGWYHAVLVAGETVFSRGPEHLADDLLLIRPTVMLAVPRIYERLYARLTKAVLEGPLYQRILFHLALKDSTRRYTKRLTAGLVAGVQQRFGGRLTMAISGGAPLAPEISKAFIALGVPLIQGYGLTEAGPVVSVNLADGSGDADSAGRPLDNVETRIGPDGELLVRSPSLMQGYWQDAIATARVIDECGWLHTGDKASRLSGDAVVLTGRLKDVLVMSTGVKCCPAEIESHLTADPLFEQVLVLGESRPYLVALVVADSAALIALKRFVADSEDSEDEAHLHRALLQRCRSRLADLPHSHQLLRVALVPGFTLANGLVTATLKPRRAAIAKTHAALIESLYAGHCHGFKSDCGSNAAMRD